MQFVLDRDFQKQKDLFNKEYGESCQLIKEFYNLIHNMLHANPIQGGSPDQTIYVLGMTCLSEVNEILSLCTWGYGVGSTKISRALYERVVTLSYLSTHPEEIPAFRDYSWVHFYKMQKESIQFTNTPPWTTAPLVEENFERVKGNYQQTDCKKCKTKRLQPSWTKKSMPELSGSLGATLRQLYWSCFLCPTFDIHSTYFGALRQFCSDGVLQLNTNTEKESVNGSLDSMKALLMALALAISKHFNVRRDRELIQLADKLRKWISEHPLPTGPQTPNLPPR
jgi:hypothetical protein